MKYSIKEIYASLSPEKRKADGTVSKYLLRPLSWPVSWFFLSIGVTPNMVTGISAIACLLALICTMLPYPALQSIAIILFFIFALLDCVDGNMARTIGKKTIYGVWVDAAGGYIAYFTIFFAMAFSCLLPQSGGNFYRELFYLPWGEATWFIIAGFALSSNFLMRLFHQAFKNAELTAGLTIKPGKEKKFSEEIGITGYMPILYAFGFAFGFLPLVIILYLCIYGGGFLLTTVKLIKKIQKVDVG